MMAGEGAAEGHFHGGNHVLPQTFKQGTKRCFSFHRCILLVVEYAIKHQDRQIPNLQFSLLMSLIFLQVWIYL